ncbi:MAG: hypothetical protein HYZ53_27905, partial [Planctomycetes bacterium]|nr:hypothetical protein [Planctomycetota bacterium]
DPLPGAFRVYRSTTSGSGWVLIDTAYANSYRDWSVPAGAYYYVVTSVDGDPPIESPYSTEASAVVTDDPPPAPVSLGVGTSLDAYSLTWSYPFIPPDLVGVRIWKSWTPGGPYVPATAGLVSASPPFWGTRPRGPMYLRLSSVDAAGHESMSAQEVVVEGVNLVRPEPKLNAMRLGAAGSVTSTGGELVWDEETLTIRVEVGFGFDFHRVYRSDSTHDTVLGYGYSHTYEQSLTPAGADFDRYDGARGRTDRYTWNPATQSFTSPAGFYDKLEANADGTYKLTDRYGLVSTFTSIAGAYRLTEERDRNGNTLGLAYDGSRVSAVTDSAGRTVNFVYGADGRLSSLVDFYDPAQPRSVTFGYSA